MTIKRVDRVSKNGKRWHLYYIDGKYAPGVTSIIKKTVPAPQIAYWAARTVAEHVVDNLDDVIDMIEEDPEDAIEQLKAVPWEIRDEASDRGTQVHKLGEELVHGHEVDVPEELDGYVHSYVQFLDEWQPKPVLVEGVVASRRWHYCGQIDLVADLPNGARVLLDLKTSRRVYTSVALQLAGYRFAELYLDDNGAEVPMSELGITETYVVHVREDGYDCIPVDAGEAAWKTFQHLVWTARQFDGPMTSWLGDPATPPVETTR